MWWWEVLTSDIFLKLLPLWALGVLVSANEVTLPPHRFHSSESSPGASPLAAAAELTPFLQHRSAGGANSPYKSFSCGALMQDNENWFQCLLLLNESRLITCSCLQIAHSFLLLQCPAWHEKKFNCTGKQSCSR